MRALLIALTLCACGSAEAQFLPDGAQTVLVPAFPAFQFTAGAPGAYASITATTGQTISCSRASSATYLTSPTTLATASSNQCAVDYRGLQSEGSSTNLILQSEAFDNAAWAGGNVGTSNPVVTANVAIAPDGNTTADQISFPAVTGTTNFSVLYQHLANGVATVTCSIWLKVASGTGTVYLSISSTGSGPTAATSASLTTIWQRVAVTGSFGGADANYCYLGFDTRGSSGQGGAGAQTVLAWGAQIEPKPFATSYIATTSTAVTRSADTNSFTKPAAVTLTGSTYSSSVTAQLEGINTAGTQDAMGANQNFVSRISITPGNTNSPVWAYSDVAANGSSVTYSDANKLTATKYAARKNGTSFNVFAAGTQGSTATLSTQATEPTTIYLGSNNGATNLLYGWISSACLDSNPARCAP